MEEKVLLDDDALEKVTGGITIPDWMRDDNWKKIVDAEKKAVNWLKENGYWDQIVYMAKKYGRKAGIALATKYVCEELAIAIFDDLLPNIQ